MANFGSPVAASSMIYCKEAVSVLETDVGQVDKYESRKPIVSELHTVQKRLIIVEAF